MRVKLVDLWGGFRHDIFKCFIDSEICNVEFVNDNPDLVISFFGDREAKKYNCLRMQMISGEAWFNDTPILFNYALGDIDGSLEDTERSIYFPHYVMRAAECQIDGVIKHLPTKEEMKNKKLCCLLGACTRGDQPRRKIMADRLSSVGLVDAIITGRHGRGKLPNDTGYRTKYNWVSNYKFNIAFENTLKTGYLTEKPFDAFWAGSIPIFYGDRATFNRDFILDQSLIFTGYNEDEVIDAVQYYDTHEDAYISLLEKNHFIYADPVKHYRRKLSEFLGRIEKAHALG